MILFGDIRLKLWERIVFYFSGSLFILGTLVYFSPFYFRHYFFRAQDEYVRTEIGKTIFQAGGINRKSYDQAGFSLLESDAQIYDQDLIMTDQSSSAIFELHSGDRLIVSSGSMVLIDSFTRWSGFKRVQVVHFRLNSGKIQLIPGRDSLTESWLVLPDRQWKVDFLSSPEMKVAQIDQKILEDSTKDVKKTPIRIYGRIRGTVTGILGLDPMSTVAEKKLEVEWLTEPGDLPVRVLIEKKKKSGNQLILSKVVKPVGPQGQVEFTIQSPGLYKWSVEPMDDLTELVATSRASATFQVNTDFLGIEDASYDAEDRKARWNWYPGAERYAVHFFEDELEKSRLWSTQINRTSLDIPFEKLFSRKFASKVYFRVKTPLGNSGFFASSELVPIDFAKMVSQPSYPANGALMKIKDLQEVSGGAVEFSWSRNGKVFEYQIEIYGNESLTKLVQSSKVGPSVKIHRQKLEPGKYWWRVLTGIAPGVTTPSEVWNFEVLAPVTPRARTKPGAPARPNKK